VEDSVEDLLAEAEAAEAAVEAVASNRKLKRSALFLLKYGIIGKIV
jgi:hypothetical protein